MKKYIEKISILFISLILISSTVVSSTQFVYGDNAKINLSSKTSTNPSPPENPGKKNIPKNDVGSLIRNSLYDDVDNYNRLYEKARNDGNVRVLVELNVDFKPEGDYKSENEIKNQRQEIRNSQDALMEALSSEKTTPSHKFKYIPYVAMTVNKNSLDKLVSLPLVKSIHEDKLNKPFLSASIPLIGSDDLHTADIDGTGITVVILDTGVDKQHSFFSNRVIEEACFSSTGQGRGYSYTTVCPNGLDQQIGTGAGVPCLQPTHSLNGCDHGTHVAGITAGSGSSFSGVAPNANIMSVQVFSSFSGNKVCGKQNSPCVLAWDSDVIAGLEHVYSLRNSHNFAAANLSLGGDPFTTGTCDGEPHKLAMDMLRSVEIATVVSSGNDFIINAISSPACISTAISVGATSKFDVVATFSNTGSELDLLAPGVSIQSSVPGGGFAFFSGTSMAAPHVTGSWALLKQSTPSATVDDILTTLKNTGVPILDTRPADCCGLPAITKPRIQLDQAFLSLAASEDFCGNPLSSYNVIFGTDGDDTLEGTGNADLIFGGSGNDDLKGRGGPDCIMAGSGNDMVDGGGGDDTIYGQDGIDNLSGWKGNDTIYGGAGNDLINGGEHDDTITGGAGDDFLFGDRGNDTINGQDGNDLALAEGGNDTINGDAGNDYIVGGAGDDTITGGLNDDIILGFSGIDSIDGNSGFDICIDLADPTLNLLQVELRQILM